jgi:SAM-dependent methyltransferase
MSSPFGSIYSDAYDLLYTDKDYRSECDMLEQLLDRYSNSKVSSVLDLGCGTGNHVFEMSSRGYRVLGVDRSEDMLAVARRRLGNIDIANVRLQQGDVREIDLHEQFDAVLIMFAVLGYQIENNDVLATLRASRRHLKTGSLLIFDVWYGPAVLQEKPSDRFKIIPTTDGRILRGASGQLDVSRHSCDVHYHLWRIAGDRLVAETRETHRMRYFFPQEIDLFLSQSGFSLIRLGAFPQFDRDPDLNTWNVTAVARAI